MRQVRGRPGPTCSWAAVLGAVVVLLTLLVAGGCGASIQAVYEGDVRFEHCMALDAQPEIKRSLRRECWVEWITFYTYGQTRDRVLHAQLRIQQLAPGGAVPEQAAPRGSGLLLLPPAAGSALGQGETEERCAGECRAVHRDCSRDCDKQSNRASCRKSCSVGLRSCLRQCA